MSKLKLCPFCGSVVITPCNHNGKNATCINNSCPIRYLRMDVILWNTRPIEDKLQTDNKRLLDIFNDECAIGAKRDAELKEALSEIEVYHSGRP